MIVYQLACAEGHFFEGWFASARVCDEQAANGLLQCPSCSSYEVRKLPSAPYVHTSGTPPSALAPSAERHVRLQVLERLRGFLLANTENVGPRFAEVARRIHYEEEAQRNIRGRVTAEEAQNLAEEGVEAMMVPPGILPSEEEFH